MIHNPGAGQRCKGIRVKLLQHVDSGGVEELRLVIRLRVEFLIRDIIGIWLSAPHFLVRPDLLAAVEKLPAHIDLASQRNRSIASVSGNGSSFSGEPIVCGCARGGVAAAVEHVQAVGGGNPVIRESDFTGSMRLRLICVVRLQRAQICAGNWLLTRCAGDLHIADCRLHIHGQIAIRRLHHMLREGEDHLQITGSKGLCVIVVELLAVAAIGVLPWIVIGRIEGIAADLQMQNCLFSRFVDSRQRPTAAAVAGFAVISGVEGRRVVGIIGTDTLFVLIVPVHVEGGAGLPVPPAIIGFLIFLQCPEDGGNKIAAGIVNALGRTVQIQAALHMQLHFQTVRRNLQSFDALSCGYRLAIGIGIAHHHSDAVAQHGAVDDIGRCLAFGSACFLAGSRVKIAGIGKFGVLLQGHVVAARGGNRQTVAVNGGMVLLVLLVALHPHADSGLQRLPILHGTDFYT